MTLKNDGCRHLRNNFAGFQRLDHFAVLFLRQCSRLGIDLALNLRLKMIHLMSLDKKNSNLSNKVVLLCSSINFFSSFSFDILVYIICKY